MGQQFLVISPQAVEHIIDGEAAAQWRTNLLGDLVLAGYPLTREDGTGPWGSAYLDLIYDPDTSEVTACTPGGEHQLGQAVSPCSPPGTRST